MGLIHKGFVYQLPRMCAAFVRVPGLQRSLIHLLISVQYKLFVCLLNFFPYFLPSVLPDTYLHPYLFTF